MLTDRQVDALESAWAPARAEGALGSATIQELYDHAAGFVPAASVDFGVGIEHRSFDAIDVGTGVGVPGILLALRYRLSRWRLVDASAKRCRLAERAVEALDLRERVVVVHGRVDELGRSEAWRASADLVVSRMFGPPPELAECATPLLTREGRLVVSVSSTTKELWDQADLTALSAEVETEWATANGRYLCVRRLGELDERFPRRPASRRRSPLF